MLFQDVILNENGHQNKIFEIPIESRFFCVTILIDK